MIGRAPAESGEVCFVEIPKGSRKVICVPTHDPYWNGYAAVEQLPQLLREEIEQFFAIYKQLERKTVEIGGWKPRAVALEAIAAAHERHASA